MMLSDVCLSDVCRVHPGGVCGRPAGWRVLADRARLGRPGSRLPLRASVAGLGGGISWRPPAYILFFLVTVGLRCYVFVRKMCSWLSWLKF